MSTFSGDFYINQTVSPVTPNRPTVLTSTDAPARSLEPVTPNRPTVLTSTDAPARALEPVTPNRPTVLTLTVAPERIQPVTFEQLFFSESVKTDNTTSSCEPKRKAKRVLDLDQ